jgi:hypothetical protein
VLPVIVEYANVDAVIVDMVVVLPTKLENIIVDVYIVSFTNVEYTDIFVLISIILIEEAFIALPDRADTFIDDVLILETPIVLPIMVDAFNVLNKIVEPIIVENTDVDATKDDTLVFPVIVIPLRLIKLRVENTTEDTDNVL